MVQISPVKKQRFHFSKRITAQKTCAVHGGQAGHGISGRETNGIIHILSTADWTWHCLGTCGLEALSSAAKNKCVTPKTSEKESQALAIAKAIPSIAAFLVLCFISPVYCPLCSLRCLKQKAFQQLSMKKMPHPGVWGKKYPQELWLHSWWAIHQDTSAKTLYCFLQFLF